MALTWRSPPPHPHRTPEEEALDRHLGPPFGQGISLDAELGERLVEEDAGRRLDPTQATPAPASCTTKGARVMSRAWAGLLPGQ